MPDTDPLGNPLIAATPQADSPVAKPVDQSQSQGFDPLGNPLQSKPPALSETYKQVMDTDPDKNAKVQAIHSKTGDPPGFIANNLDAAEKAANAPTSQELDTLKDTHPVIADWLNGADNMAVAHDAIPAMKQTESVWDDFKKGFSEYAGGINQFMKWQADVAPYSGLGLINKFSGGHLFDNEEDFWKQQVKEAVTPEADKPYLQVFGEKDYGAIGRKLVMQIPNIVNMAAGGELVGVKGLAGLIGIQTGVSSFEQSKEAGLSTPAAATSATMKGAVSAATMMVPLGYFSKIFGPLSEELGPVGAKAVIKAGMKEWLGGTIGMGAQNTIQTLSNAIADKLSGEDPRALEGIGGKLAESGVEGLTLGGVIGGLGLGTKALSPEEQATKQTEEDAKKASTAKEAFLKVVEDAKQNPLATRSPEKFKEVLDKLNPNGPQDVHIPVEEFKTFYQDLKQNPEDVAKSFGDDAHDSYLNAEQTGGHVTVPLSDLISKKADSGELEKLADHIKFDPMDKTVTEAKEAKEAKDQQAATPEAKEAETEKVLKEFTNDIEKKIQAAGGKKSMATTVTKFIKTMSERSGVPLDKLIQGYKFNFFSTKEPSKSDLYDQAAAMGVVSPTDYMEKNGLKILVEKPDTASLAGGAKEDALKNHESRLSNFKSAEVPTTTNPEAKGAVTPSQLAGRLFDEANNGTMNRMSLPEEWWDEGRQGRPDADHDTILEILRNSGSGIEDMKTAAQQDIKTLYQSKFDAYRMSPEKQDKIFGTYSDQWASNSLSGIEAAGKADNGKIYTGDNHGEVVSAGAKEGQSFGRREQFGFKLPDGTFLTRQEAKDRFGFATSEELHALRGEKAKDLVYYQDHRGTINMAGTPGQRSFDIYVHEGKDASTFFHEPAHAFLEIFKDLSSKEGAPEELKEDSEKLFKWLGIKDWSELSTDHHEQFARGFEYRLWEGKTPVSGLRRIFDRFTQWLREVYPSADIMGKYLGYNMTDEMRGVYDRMIATSKEIDEAQEMMGYNKEAPQGATPEELEMWRKAQGASKAALFDKIIKEKTEQLTPTAHEMREKERVAITKQATEEVGKMPVFQAEDYLTEKVGDVKEGAKRVLEGKATPEDEMWFGAAGMMHLGTEDPLQAAKIMEGIDRQSEIQERVDEHMAQFQPRVQASKEQIQRSMYEGDAGEANSKMIALEKSIIHTQILIEKSLGQMPQPERQTTTEGKTEETKTKPAVTEATKPQPKPEDKVAKEFGSQLKKNLEELPEVKKIKAEAMATARKQAEYDSAMAKTQAKELLDGMPITQAGDYRVHMTAERNAYAKSKQAEKEGDLAKAYDWKQKQLLNQELAKQAIENRKVITKAVSTIKGFSKLEKDPSRLTYGHWKIMKGLMEDYGFKQKTPNNDSIQETRAKALADRNVEDDKITDQTGMVREGAGWRKETLSDFVKRMWETRSDVEARITDDLPKPMAFGKLTFGQLKDLKNNLAVIYQSGNLDTKIKIGQEEVKLNDFAEKTVKQITQSVGQEFGRNPMTMTESQKKIQNLAGIVKNGPLNLPQNLSEITGLGKDVPNLTKGYDLKLNEGKSEWLKNERTIKEEFQGLRDKHYQKAEQEHWNDRDAKNGYVIKTSADEKPQIFSKWNLFNIFRLMGSETGYRRLTTGNGYTDQDLKTIIGYLEEKDIRFLKDWAAFDSKMFGKMVDTEQRVHNFEPKGVDKRPIETKYGIVEGMYHPLKYDYEHPNMRGKDKPIEVDDRGKPLNPYLNKSMLKGRAKNYPYPVRLDEGVYLDHLKQVSKYLAYEEPVNDINKYLNHPDVDAAIKGGFGGGPMGGKWLYKNHLDFVVHGDPQMNAAYDAINQGFHATRVLNIMYHIATRPFLYPVKLLSDMNTITHEPSLGPVKALSYMVKSVPLSPGFSKMQNEVTKDSELMKSRAISAVNYDMYSVNDVFKTISSKERFQKLMQTFYFWPERLADRLSYAAWKDIRDTHKANGIDHVTAGRLADDHVAKMLGSGEDIYRSYPQHGPEILQQISPAWTFFGAQLNRAITTGRIKYLLTPSEARANPVKDTFIKASIIGRQVLMYATIPAIVEELARNYLYHRPEQRKESLKDHAESAAWESPLKLIPGGQRIVEAFKYPKLREKILGAFPSGEFANDIVNAGIQTLHGLEGKHLSDKELHDALGWFEAAGLPERLDSIIVNLHHDMQTHEFSWYDIFGPIRGKTAGRGGSSGR